MVLIIDTTDKECMVGVDDGRKFDVKKWRWKKDTGGEILHNIQKLLKKSQKKLENIDAIFVNQGPGSYTGTRVGITIASTLGWSLNVPVVGYSGKDRREITSQILGKLSKNKLSKNHFPTPIYG